MNECYEKYDDPMRDTIYEQAFDEGVDWVLTNLKGLHIDATVEPWWWLGKYDNMSFANMKDYLEPGDFSVGLMGSAGVGLLDDQANTVIQDLVNRLKDALVFKNVALDPPAYDIPMAVGYWETQRKVMFVKCTFDSNAPKWYSLDDIAIDAPDWYKAFDLVHFSTADVEKLTG